MASQLNRRTGTTASPGGRRGFLRVLLAVAIALLSLPLLTSTAYAGEPGVCDTNEGTGKIDSFTQNTQPDGSGDWVNGNLTKSGFKEGDWVPQRIEMSKLAAGENELAFTYDVWKKTQNTVKWAYDEARFKSMTGGATVTRWLVQDQEGPTATVLVTFDVPAGVTTATLYYDLHIASELDHGAGSGAGSISGSPYHGGLLSLNCKSTGMNANQIAASAIAAGLLTVVKDATPADGTDFHFSITPGGDASTFALDVDSDPTLPDRLTYRVPPGTYTVEELNLPDGWNLTGVTCSVAPSASTPTSRTVSIADDAQVTCTFKNDKAARKDLTVTSTATPSYTRDYDWTVDKSVSGPAEQRIADGQSADFTYDVAVTPTGPKDSAFEVSGTISVTNPNPIPVDGVTITDTIPGATCTVLDGSTPVTGPVSIPANGKSFTYTCTMGAGTSATSTGTSSAQLSWNAADYYGTTGSATGNTGFDFGTVTPTVTDASVTVTDSHYNLATYPGGNVVQAAGGAKTFTYPLTWPGEPGTCTKYDNTATITEPDGDKQSDGARVEVCEGKDLTVAKTVVSDYTRTYPWSLTKKVVGADTKNVGPDGTATFDYEVTATAGRPEDSAWGMSGTITVHNPNSWPVTVTDVVDQADIGGGVSCVVDKGNDLSVAAGGDRTFDYTCTFDSQPSYDGKNTATVTWTSAQLVSPHTSATGEAAIVATRWSETSVDKTVTVLDDETDPAHPVELGTATWTGEGATKTFSYTGPAQKGKQGECVDYTNHAWIEELPAVKASATSRVCWPLDVSVTKTVDATYDTTYFWDITKDVDRTSAEVEPGQTAPFTYTVVAKPNGSQDSNWAMAGTITVSNPNTFKAVTVTLSDQYDGGGVCTPESTSVVVPKATRSNGTITPGTATVGYSCDFSGQPAYKGTNTATASWDGHQVSGTADVTFRQAGKTDFEVPILDDMAQPGTTPQVIKTVRWDGSLAERTATYTSDLGGEPGTCVDHTNTARVDVTNADVSLLPQLVVPGMDPFAQQTVTVCEKAPLVVSKDATASYDTRYFWDVSKDVDQTSAEVGPGKTAPFTYTVVAKPHGSQDSHWAMHGTITVSNPNTYRSAEVTLSDEYDGGGVCTPESTTVEVPKGGSVEVPYSCAFTQKPKYDGTNTATATWDGHDYTGTTPVTFRQAGTTDYQVPVYDDFTKPGTSNLLGTATWDDPLAKRTFTNTLDLGGAPGDCVDHTNTAWVEVTGDDPSAQQTVTVCETGLLVVSKDATASYDTRYFWDVSKYVDSTSAEVGQGQEAPFHYTVIAKPDGSEDSNWQLSGTITLTNPNRFKSATVTLADHYDGGGVCTPESETVEVAKDSTVKVPYTCTFTEKPAYSGTNTVTATWDGDTYRATAPVTFAQAERTDYQVEVRDDLAQPGDDHLLGTATWDAPVAERTFTSTLDLGGKPGECVEHTNTAWVVVEGEDPVARQGVEVCTEAPLTIGAKTHASFERAYHWLIDKSVDRKTVELTRDGGATFAYTVTATPDGFTDSGYAMGGTITVTNPNSYTGGTITATVTDVPSVGEGVTCEVTDGTDVVLEPGQSKELSYTCSFDGTPQKQGTDTATATWTGPDGKARSVSTGEEPVSFTEAGDEYRTVTVTDDHTTPSVLGKATWNADAEPTVFEYTLTHEGTKGTCVDHTNTATIEETGQSDSETVTVCAEGGLVVTSSAEASFDRTYAWDIDKTADRALLVTAKGKTGTVHYSVDVTPNGFVDSGWTMTGSVSVLNPNAYKDVTVDLTDTPDLGDGATCTVADGQDQVVPAGETRTFGYSCTFEGEPSYDGSNSVLVDWGSGQVSATTAVPFEMAEVDRTVTVTDDHVDPAELGTVTWDENGEPTSFGYDLELGGRVDRCDAVTNTATIVETGQQAQADVVVCGPKAVVNPEEPKPEVKSPPPVDILPAEEERPLPSTGAPANAGLWTTVGALMVAAGAALLFRRRRQEL